MADVHSWRFLMRDARCRAWRVGPSWLIFYCKQNAIARWDFIGARCGLLYQVGGFTKAKNSTNSTEIGPTIMGMLHKMYPGAARAKVPNLQ